MFGGLKRKYVFGAMDKHVFGIIPNRDCVIVQEEMECDIDNILV